jgi:hypothetical protein
VWDGFWIQSFRRGTLIVSGSHDIIYGRDFDLIFKGVIFFNVPSQWNDSNVDGDLLLRIAPLEEFKKSYPFFETKDHLILAIDMHLEINKDVLPGAEGNVNRIINRAWEPFTFFLVTRHVYFNKCSGPHDSILRDYEDPFIDELEYACMKNRVI